MKATLKLSTSFGISKYGFPVYVDLVHQQKRKRKCIGYSFIDHWNITTNQPLKTHPNYFELLPVVLEYQAKIKKVNFSDFNFNQALNYLFDIEDINDMRFYEACLQYCDASTNGILYKTVLNSFKLYFPGILVKEITPDIAKLYMHQIKKHQKANGVHTYMRTLNALFNKVSNSSNPFTGIRPKKERTENKALVIEDVRKIATTRTYVNKYDAINTNESINYYRYIWLLMFYLGGIDCIDLAKLRYDQHVINGRVQFNRSKGGTSVLVNNMIVPQALEILKQFNCKPYLVPIYKYGNHNQFVSNMNDRFTERTADLQLTKRPLTKSARYTFITRAQQLLIDERITVEIVGHEQHKTHSIYTDEFPMAVRDEAHLKIVSF